MPSIAQIIAAIEERAPLGLQESWDNSGVQAGLTDVPCTGVMVAVDHSAEVVAEAVEAGCNLVVAHHPIIFRPLRRLVGATSSERAVMAAIRAGVTLYSAHTSLDNAPEGVSAEMARILGLKDVTPLVPTGENAGTGAIGLLPGGPMPARDFIAMVKERFGAPVARCSTFDPAMTVEKIALCGGSGHSFIDNAVDAGADLYLTGDLSYHNFQERHRDILLVDIGHFETEQCTKSIFYHIVTEKFPNFAVRYSKLEKNTILYL